MAFSASRLAVSSHAARAGSPGNITAASAGVGVFQPASSAAVLPGVPDSIGLVTRMSASAVTTRSTHVRVSASSSSHSRCAA